MRIDAEELGLRSGISPAQKIQECVLGMIHFDEKERWGCDRVKDAVEEILRDCEGSADGKGNERRDGQGTMLRKVTSLSGTETEDVQ